MFQNDFSRTFPEPFALESRRWSMAVAAFLGLWAMLLLSPIMLTIAAPLLSFGILYLLKDLNESNIWASLAMVALALAMPTLMMLAGLGVMATPIVGLIFAASMLVASVVYAIRRFKEFNNDKTGTWIAIAGLSVMVLGTIMLGLAMFGVFTAPLWVLCGLVGLFSILPAYHHTQQFKDESNQNQSILAILNPSNIFQTLKKYGPLMLSVGILPLAFLVFPAYAMMIFAFFLVAALGFTAYSAIRSAQSDRNVTRIPGNVLQAFKKTFLNDDSKIDQETRQLAYNDACSAYMKIVKDCEKPSKIFDQENAKQAAIKHAGKLFTGKAENYSGKKPVEIYRDLLDSKDGSRSRSGSSSEIKSPVSADGKRSILSTSRSRASSSNSEAMTIPENVKQDLYNELKPRDILTVEEAYKAIRQQCIEEKAEEKFDQAKAIAAAREYVFQSHSGDGSTPAPYTIYKRLVSSSVEKKTPTHGSPLSSAPLTATTAPSRATEVEDDKLVAQTNRLQDENKSLKEQLQKAIQAEKKSHKTLETIQQTMNTVETDTEKLSREHKALQKSAVKAQEKLATLQKQRQAEQKTLAALQEKASSLTSQLTDQSKVLNTAQADAKQAKDQLSKQEQALREAKSQAEELMKTVQTAKNALSVKKDELKQVTGEFKKENSALKTRLQAQNEQLSRLKSIRGEEKQALNTADAKVEKLTKLLNNNRKDLSEAQGELKNLSEENVQLKQKGEATKGLKKKLIELKNSLGEKAIELNELKAQMEVLKSRNTQLSKEIVASKAEQKKATRTLNESKAQHKAKQKASEQEISSLKKEVAQLQKTIGKNISESQNALSKAKADFKQAIGQIKSEAEKDMAEAAITALGFGETAKKYKKAATEAQEELKSNSEALREAHTATQKSKEETAEAQKKLGAVKKELATLQGLRQAEQKTLEVSEEKVSELTYQFGKNQNALSTAQAKANRAKLASMKNGLGALKNIKTCLDLHHRTIESLKDQVKEARHRGLYERIFAQTGRLLNSLFLQEIQSTQGERKASSQDPFQVLETKLLNMAKSIAAHHDTENTLSSPMSIAGVLIQQVAGKNTAKRSLSPIEQVNGFIEKLHDDIEKLETTIKDQSQALAPDGKSIPPRTPGKDGANRPSRSGDFKQQPITPPASPPTPSPTNLRNVSAASCGQGENLDAKHNGKNEQSQKDDATSPRSKL